MISPKSSFRRLQAEPSSRFPVSSLQQTPSMTYSKISQVVERHHNSMKQGFPVMGEVLEAQGSSDLVRDNLTRVIFLSILSSLGIPIESFLYFYQSSFLVRNSLGTVGPRELIGNQQLKPMISTKN